MRTIRGFQWTCTKGHLVTASFDDATLEELRQAVTAGKVDLFCFTCGVNYGMGPDVMKNITEWLARVRN